MTICENWPKRYVSDKICYCFIADAQQSGQGQRTNSWTSPPGNCYVNYLFTIDSHLAMFAAQMASLSVVEVLETYCGTNTSSPNLKWINDVFMGGKKISGVLPKCETNDNKCYLWIGIGVNINGVPIAGSTSLKEQLSSSKDIEITPFIDKLSQILMENVK